MTTSSGGISGSAASQRSDFNEEILLQSIKAGIGVVSAVVGSYFAMRMGNLGLQNQSIDLRSPTINLTLKAKKGLLSPVKGRESEILALIQILSQRDKPNAVLVGLPGVGKTAIVEGLAQKIAEGQVPNSLKDANILMITMSDFSAAASYQGQFEQRIQQFMKDLKFVHKPIVFIDEGHTIMNTGVGGSNSLPEQLKPGLARGEFHMILCTTTEEFRLIEQNGAFLRRFGKISVQALESAFLNEVVRLRISAYEKHHGCRFEKGAIEYLMGRARTLSSGVEPDRTLTVFDRFGAYVSMSRFQSCGQVHANNLRSEMRWLFFQIFGFNLVSGGVAICYLRSKRGDLSAISVASVATSYLGVSIFGSAACCLRSINRLQDSKSVEAPVSATQKMAETFWAEMQRSVEETSHSNGMFL
jgi:ATP-dependent Clp protease ATP-binding subunit ClpA